MGRQLLLLSVSYRTCYRHTVIVFSVDMKQFDIYVILVFCKSSLSMLSIALTTRQQLSEIFIRTAQVIEATSKSRKQIVFFSENSEENLLKYK